MVANRLTEPIAEFIEFKIKQIYVTGEYLCSFICKQCCWVKIVRFVKFITGCKCFAVHMVNVSLGGRNAASMQNVIRWDMFQSSGDTVSLDVDEVQYNQSIYMSVKHFGNRVLIWIFLTKRHAWGNMVSIAPSTRNIARETPSSPFMRRDQLQSPPGWINILSCHFWDAVQDQCSVSEVTTTHN